MSTTTGYIVRLDPHDTTLQVYPTFPTIRKVEPGPEDVVYVDSDTDYPIDTICDISSYFPDFEPEPGVVYVVTIAPVAKTPARGGRRAASKATGRGRNTRSKARRRQTR